MRSGKVVTRNYFFPPPLSTIRWRNNSSQTVSLSYYKSTKPKPNIW